MARITVEDCLEHVDSRFNLVLLATKRARQIVNGVDPLIPRENDKPTVIALREIAAGLVSQESMAAHEVASATEMVEMDEIDLDEMPLEV